MKKLLILLLLGSCQETYIRCDCTHSFEYFDSYEGYRSEDIVARVNCEYYEEGVFDLTDNLNNVIGKKHVVCD